MTNENTEVPELSLFGGPLQRLGLRLGLARGDTGSFRFGLALSLLAWGILVLLTFLQGLGTKIFSLALVGVHVRLMVVMPLFFVGEAFVAPRMGEFVRNLLGSGIVPEPDLPVLASDVRRASRLAGSRLAEAFFILLAFAGPLLDSVIDLPGGPRDWVSVLDKAGGRPTLLNGWYLMFCLPLFRFLFLRWLWRLGLWWYFLWRVAKLNLRLVPTHSDGAGGLGYLEVVQEHFAPLALALSMLLSASFAEGIVAGTMTFEALSGLVPAVLALVAALFLGPLFLFSPKLWKCRATGMDEYMAMAARYVNAFDRKWVRDEAATGESQLGTGDMQSLADLTNSLNVVRNMRLVPYGRRLVLLLASVVILPMLPLVLLKFPVSEIVVRLVRTLTGL